MKRAIPMPASHVDPLLACASLGLVVVGAVMVGSASISLADSNFGDPLYYLVRHLGAIGMGCAAALAVTAVPSELWHRLHWFVLLACIALLALVLAPGLGQTVNGATRWLELGPVRFQASEPARLFLVMYLASYAVRHQAELLTSFWGFLKPMVIVALVCALLLGEPDFGAAVVVTLTSLGIVFVAGARLRDFVLALFVAGGALGMLAVNSAYRLERLTGFLNPWNDPFASGFQLTQSLIAIGRGEWLGVGLGESVQKLFYLPEAHTDFVFAVVAEELGFAGASFVVLLYALIVYRAIAMGREAIGEGMVFQGLLSTGIGLMLGIEALINIGVNTGLLPTKGLTLPLISYGRSSTIVTLIALGLLLRIHRELSAVQRASANRRSGR